MKNAVSEYKGYTVHTERHDIPGKSYCEYTYWVSIDGNVVKNKTWKTLRGVFNWIDRQ